MALAILPIMMNDNKPYIPKTYRHSCGREYYFDELKKLPGGICTRCDKLIDSESNTKPKYIPPTKEQLDELEESIKNLTRILETPSEKKITTETKVHTKLELGDEVVTKHITHYYVPKFISRIYRRLCGYNELPTKEE